MSDLIERCKEILAWKRTGLLPGDALRQYAEAKWQNNYAALQLAEVETVREALEALTAQPAQAVLVTEQEILDAAEAIKAKRVEIAVKNTLGRVGSKCSQCGGVIGTDHNGYHLFNRCQSCNYVPMFMKDGSESPPPPDNKTETTE